MGELVVLEHAPNIGKIAMIAAHMNLFIEVLLE
jgi:hypothetical protein